MLADLPPLLRATLDSLLSGQPDVVVVRGDAQEGLIAASAAVRAGVVVVAGRDPADLQGIDAGLAWATNFSILALSLDGQSACIYRIRAETQVVDDVSPQGLRAALAALAEEPPHPLT